MIEIRIDLLPCGNRELRRSIGRMEIINDATGSIEIGNYIIRFYDRHNILIKQTELRRWSRSNTIWDMLKRIFSRSKIQDLSRIYDYSLEKGDSNV
jgi:hypothetical protein